LQIFKLLTLIFQGWGCMLRAGQMLVAECLLRQRLGRNYVWSESAIEDERYTEILELFRDTHSAELSLQQVSFSA
jgi:cysteine protease ATG4